MKETELKRGVKLILPNKKEFIVKLPGTTFTEIISTHLFLLEIKKAKSGLINLSKRNPQLLWSSKPIAFSTVEDMLQDLIRAKKYVRAAPTDLDFIDQLFTLDLFNMTISLHKVNTHEEIGSMPIMHIFNNWQDIFYPDEPVVDETTLFVAPSLEPETPVESRVFYIHALPPPPETVTLDWTEETMDAIADWKETEEKHGVHPNTDKMEEELDTASFEFWNYIVNELKIVDTINIDYSGGGDSGDIDSIDVISKGVTEDGKAEYQKIIKESYNDISNKCWHLIDKYEAGFYNNEGGYGRIELSASKFNWEHYNYVQETVCTKNTNIIL